MVKYYENKKVELLGRPLVIVFVWSDKLAPFRTIEQRPYLAPEIKIMWEEHLVDPLIDNITPVKLP